MLVVGLMSGTSADGVDAALVEISRQQGRLAVRSRAFVSRAYSPELRAEILDCCDPATGSVDRVCRLGARLGEALAAAALEAIAAASIRPADVDLVASHGQTLYHSTQPDEPYPSTLQVGAPAVIAAVTGITTIADFRPADVAAGGQGAPLVPFADHLLFSDDRVSRAVQNVGGIANVTALRAGAAAGEVFAFDTGPGNMVIDALAQRYLSEPFDRDGQAAARGQVHRGLLAELLDDEYFRRPPPKSTGREQFGRSYAARLAARGLAVGLGPDDLIATATALTAESIAGAIRRFVGPVDELILGGGGARNATLVRWLASTLPETRVLRHEDFGIDSDAKEAIAFAILGYETLFGLPSNLPSCTGARRHAVLGSITPGLNYHRLMQRVVEGDDEEGDG